MTRPFDLPLDPMAIPSLSEAEALEALDRIIPALPGRSLLDIPTIRGARAWVLGDTHADWPTARVVLTEHVLGRGGSDRAILLGDYVDRTPPELPLGSLVNALYLLSLAAAFPERIHLLRGNHETQRRIPGVLQEAHVEARELFGDRTPVGERLEDAFERLPLAARMESGCYLAHAGFPRELGGSWRERISREDDELLFEVVWNDLDGSPVAGQRGIPISPFTEPETEDFLRAVGATLFLRGHDPYLAGQYRFHGRVLTLHTTRVFGWAGLWVAGVSLATEKGPKAGVELFRVEPASLPPVRSQGKKLRSSDRTSAGPGQAP